MKCRWEFVCICSKDATVDVTEGVPVSVVSTNIALLT